MGNLLYQLAAGLAAAALLTEPLVGGYCACEPGRRGIQRVASAHACCKAKVVRRCCGGGMCCRTGQPVQTGDSCGVRCNCQGSKSPATPVSVSYRASGPTDLGLAVIFSSLPDDSPAAGWSHREERPSTATPLERCSALCRFLL